MLCTRSKANDMGKKDKNQKGGFFSRWRRKKSGAQSCENVHERVQVDHVRWMPDHMDKKEEDEWYPNGYGSLKTNRRLMNKQRVPQQQYQSAESLLTDQPEAEGGTKIGISLKKTFKDGRYPTTASEEAVDRPETSKSCDSQRTKNSVISSESINNLAENMKYCVSIVDQITPATSMASLGDEELNRPHVLSEKTTDSRQRSFRLNRNDRFRQSDSHLHKKQEVVKVPPPSRLVKAPSVDVLDSEMLARAGKKLQDVSEKALGHCLVSNSKSNIPELFRDSNMVIGNYYNNAEEYRQKYVKDRKTGNAYIKERLLGKGGFAKCYELIDVRTRKVFAGKIISKSRLTKPHHKDKITREIELHRHLQHPHVVNFVSCFEDEYNVYILLELCSRKSLVHVLKNRKLVTEPEARYYIRQLVEGTAYIHQQRIIHRDLKLGNMLLNELMEVKIADFGLATRVEFEGEKKMTVCGTPNYIAPEVLQRTGHSYPTDIWAIGCVLYALLVGRPPFETHTLKETYSRITANKYSIPSHVSKPARHLIQKCLTADPQQRPSLQKIMADEFFISGFNPRSLPTACYDSVPKWPSPDKKQQATTPQRPKSYAAPVSPADAMTKITSSLANMKTSKKSSSQILVQTPNGKESISPVEPDIQELFPEPSQPSRTPSSQSRTSRSAERHKSTERTSSFKSGLSSVRSNLRSTSSQLGSTTAISPPERSTYRSAPFVNGPPETAIDEDLPPYKSPAPQQAPPLLPQQTPPSEMTLSSGYLASPVVSIPSRTPPLSMATPSRTPPPPPPVSRKYSESPTESTIQPVTTPNSVGRTPARSSSSASEVNSNVQARYKPPTASVQEHETSKETVTKQGSVKYKRQDSEDSKGRGTSSAIMLYQSLGVLFEHSTPAALNPTQLPNMDVLWVTKWVDYSNKYGFGFQLSDRSVGVLFNDTTRMLLGSDGRTIQYNDLSNRIYKFSKDSPPAEHHKKSTLLQYFAQYMGEHLINGGDLLANRKLVTPVATPALFMKKWFRTPKAIVMYMSNGTLQVNFFADHSKVILSPTADDYIVTYINTHRLAVNYKLFQLKQYGCNQELYDCLWYSRRMLESIINIEGETV